MGVSTDGQLSYGFSYEEDQEFPWHYYDEDEEKTIDLEIDEWWREREGYKPLHDNLWTEKGDYNVQCVRCGCNGTLRRGDCKCCVRTERYDKDGYCGTCKDWDDRYHEERQHKEKWEEDNPVPFEEVRHCSDDCPMVILAVPGAVATNSRGYPQAIEDLEVDGDAKQKFLNFISENELFPEDQPDPQWWLSSWWG